MTEWRPVVGYEGKYLVSDCGQVQNAVRGNCLKPSSNKGYLWVQLGRKQHHSIHTLVLSAFGPAKPDGHEVNHINGDRSDNRIENLEWVTRAQNIKHAHRQLPRKLHKWARRVRVTTPTGEHLDFESQGLAAAALKSCASNISLAIRKGYLVKGNEVSYV